MTVWYEPFLALAVEGLRQRCQQPSLRIDEAAEHLGACLSRSDSPSWAPLHLVAKPGRWWYESVTQDEPRPFRLITKGDWNPDELDDYLATQDEDRLDLATQGKHRLFAVGNLETRLLDATLFELLENDQKSRRRMLTQRNAVKAIFGAIRSGRYRGVITTDIARFDRTIDRERATTAIRDLLRNTRLPDEARDAVVTGLADLGRVSEEIYRHCDLQHMEGRGLLSGSRLMTWITWVISLELRRRWRARGYQVFWVGEDVLLMAERETSDNDYADLAADVREVLGQELHPLEEGQQERDRNEQAHRYVAGVLRRSLPSVPLTYSPRVGTIRDGFRFVGFEFQPVDEHGVRVRISQKTYQRLVWSINRATRFRQDKPLFGREANRAVARRLAFLLGTADDPMSAHMGRTISIWNNREIELQLRSLDKVLERRLRWHYYVGESVSLDTLVDRLHRDTGIQINTISELRRRVLR